MRRNPTVRKGRNPTVRKGRNSAMCGGRTMPISGTLVPARPAKKTVCRRTLCLHLYSGMQAGGIHAARQTLCPGGQRASFRSNLVLCCSGLFFHFYWPWILHSCRFLKRWENVPSLRSRFVCRETVPLCAARTRRESETPACGARLWLSGEGGQLARPSSHAKHAMRRAPSSHAKR